MASVQPVTVTSEHQLFVDDYLIAAVSRITREFHQPVKYAKNPILLPRYPWEGTALLLNGSVVRDPSTGGLRMYYCSFETPGTTLKLPRMSFVCLATSKDGVNWDRPFLHNVEFKGSADNNIVLPYNCCDLLQVTYDPHDADPARRWKLSVFEYGDLSSPHPTHPGVCLYWSRDGLHNWVEGPKGVIPHAADVTIAGWDAKRRKYVAYVKIGYEGKRARAICESDDFIHWPDPKLILHADEQDPPDLELYSMEGFPYESLWLGYLRTFHAHTSYKVDTQLVYSRDGLKWNRTPGRPVFLPNGPDGTWDRGYHTMSNNPPLRVGDELWIYYGSTNNTKKERPYVGGIGLVKLRVDGFASLDAGADEGTVTTKPLILAGRKLCVNVDAAQGQLAVEVLDAAGKVLPGFDAKSCKPIKGNRIRTTVTWKHHDNLMTVAGRTVRLAFHPTHARLYSFWTEI